MLKSQFTGETMIFKSEYKGNVFYSTSIGKKNMEGKYDNGYIDVKFKKNVELENKTKINIKYAWLTFYQTLDSFGKVTKTVWQIFVNEFEEVGNEEMSDSFQALNSEIPF